MRSPQRLLIRVTVVSVATVFPCIAFAASSAGLTLSLQPGGIRNRATPITHARFEVLNVQVKELTADVRSLWLILEGKNRKGLSIAREPVKNIVKHLEIRNLVTGSTVDAVSQISGTTWQAYEVKDVVMKSGDAWHVRADVSGNKLVDMLRLTVCTRTMAMCDAVMELKANDLTSGDLLPVEPAVPLQGRWQIFRSKSKK